MSFATFQGAGSRCSGRAQPGALALMSYIVNTRRDGARNWGIYSCRRIAGTNRVSVHAEGRALDIGFSGVSNPAGTRLVNALIANNARLAGRLGIQVIIWNRRIYSRRSPQGRRYTGASPHTDHVHIELNWAAARGLTLATVRAAFGGVAPSPPATNKPSGVRLVAAWSAGRNGRWINRTDVRLLQQRLTAKGHRTVVDGAYGPATRASVLAYQRRFRALVNDGIAGNNTVNHLWR